MAKLTGDSSADIDAPIEEVYAICEDVLAAPDWQGGMLGMEAVETDGDGRAVLADVRADGKVRELHSRQRFTYEPPTAVRWAQEEGTMKMISGAWELADLGDGRTRATYRLEVDPGRVLGMTIRGPVEMALRAMLVNPRAKELAARVAQDA